MKKTGFVYDDVFLGHKTPEGHPESPERLKAITDTLKASGIWEKLIHIKPRKATFQEIEAVHTHEYVRRVKEFGKGYFDPDTYASEGSLEAALYAAGAVIEAVDLCRKGAIERAFCAVRPPGHHAEAGRAMGFCIFNNAAVGARYAQGAGYGKVFIVDFDVHHGNGTQHIFEEDDTVFYFSTHQSPHYPGTGSQNERGRGKGAGFTYNIPMPSGSGDREYLSAYNDILPGLMADFSPDIVIVSAGYDIHLYDPLSSIRISYDGIRNIVKGILSGPDVPYIFCLEGGYDLEALGKSALATIEEAIEDNIKG
ncbi:MAG: histone deacetylase [Thermodesulfovibrionales bacterium]|nr:histone deacetylase [Thermodesulfovibrionales bacterium]